MAAKRLSAMRLREVLRLHYEAGSSQRSISRSCNVPRSTVQRYLGQAAAVQLPWPSVSNLDDDALFQMLFPPCPQADVSRSEPDCHWVHRELRRKHVTKQLLWQEYRAQHANGLGYSQFCVRYRAFVSTLSPTMRQHHKAGEKMFVDFSGDGIACGEGTTGACIAKLFVAVLGASNLTYIEPVLSEDLPTWTGCHARAFAYFGGVSAITVPDNLKSGVTKPDYYDPEINRTYGNLAEHYGTVIMPARVRKPRDKAKVEQGVLLAERWVIAVLRHRKFTCLAEVREAVATLLENLNNRPMKKLGRSRRDIFNEVEKAALKPLPAKPYEFTHFKKVRVNIDYHVEYD